MNAGRGGRRAAVLAAAIAIVAASFPGGIAAAAASSEQDRIDAILELRHPAGLKRFVRRVSDPDSRRYRRYRTVGKLVRRFGASRRSQASAVSWLRRRGVAADVGRTGTYVLARVPLADAGDLAPEPSATAAARELLGGEREAVAGRVPAALRGAVDRVTLLSPAPGAYAPAATISDSGETATALTGSERPRTGTSEGCTEGREAGVVGGTYGFTPNQYLTAYGHDALHGRGLRGQGMRVSVVEIDGFARSDIEAFGECFGIRIPPAPVHLVGIDSPLSPGDETTLDLEVISSAAPGLDAIDVYEGASSNTGVMETMAAALGRPGRRPSAISISLGECEPEFYGQKSGRAIKHVTDTIAALAGGAGIPILNSSGDWGSSGCITDDRTPVGVLSVSLPSSSPFITAVGGTNVELDAGNRIVEEVVWNDAPGKLYGGGGGRSLLFHRPWWQPGPRKTAVGSRPPRLVPDIAALADITPGYAVYCTADGCSLPGQVHPGWVPFGGTSASAPLMAGGMVLLNQDAARHGQAPLGFLNPLLYKLERGSGRALRDVTSGDNDLGRYISAEAGGGFGLGCCRAGAGYDLASGLGSPVLQKMAKLARRAAR